MTAAIVICFHPNAELLRRNLQGFASEVDRVLVWRNSPEPLHWLTAEFPNALLMGDGSNQFIARPLNEALRYCQANGHTRLLTMDQDSLWTGFAAFRRDAEERGFADTAIYAPNVNGQFADAECHDVETVITSGSLIDVDKATAIGGFKEKYEIYWVDGEFCYRARRAGFAVRVLGAHALTQQFGRQTKTLFGFTTSNYSAPVYYRLIRNMLWEHREHGSRAVSVRCILHTLLFTTRGILLGEDRKFKKLTAIARGLVHGSLKSYK